MLRVCRRSLQVLTLRRSRKNALASLQAVDVSSPANPVLDTESAGQIVRTTDFSLFPSEKLEVLLSKLAAQDRRVDIVANLVHRAVDVLEEKDVMRRENKRKDFQTAIFTYFVKSMQSGDPDYGIFSIYNRVVFNEVAPKLHADKHYLIERLIAQPLLRAIGFNRTLIVDPNRVMDVTGTDAFRHVKDMYRLDLSQLSGSSLDRLLNSMRSKAKNVIHFELLDVLAQVRDPQSGIYDPLVTGSKWSLSRILKEIIRKRSKEMLLKLLVSVDETTRNDLIGVCISKHGFTGMLRFPWAHEIIDEWRIEQSLGGVTFGANYLTISTKIHFLCDNESQRDEIDNSTERRAVVSAENVFLVDSDRKLTDCKNEILKNSEFIGISFVAESILSISISKKSFVVDLMAVNPVFVLYLLRLLLNDKSTTKIVFSMESFLNRMQDFASQEEKIHFENLIDLRRSRAKRALVMKSSQPIGDLREGFSETFGEPERSITDDSVVETSVHFGGQQRMSDMVFEILGETHDRAPVFDTDLWLYRPLSEKLQIFAANDSHLLIRLEKKLRENNIMPNEVLSYDPFS